MKLFTNAMLLDSVNVKIFKIITRPIIVKMEDKKRQIEVRKSENCC